jgi:SAM-dependent methyltransferase
VPNAKAEGWQLEANSAEAYERYLVPALMARWAVRLLDLARVRPGERVLDLGCGTGVVAREAASRLGAGGRVVGLDLNEGMLAVARQASSAIRLPIEWRQGDATTLPFADGEFDLVLCHQVLQFVSDGNAAALEMRRVLTPRGRAAIGVCRPIEYCPAYVTLAAALRRHVGAEAEAMMRSPFPPWTIDEVRGLFTGAGFRDVRVEIEVTELRYPSPEEFLRREAACSPLAEAIAALAEPARAALVDEITTALRSRCDDDGVVFPIETYRVLACC